MPSYRYRVFIGKRPLLYIYILSSFNQRYHYYFDPFNPLEPTATLQEAFDVSTACVQEIDIAIYSDFLCDTPLQLQTNM